MDARKMGEFSLDYAVLSEGETTQSPSKDKEVLVAVVRKDHVLKMIEQVSEAGLNVIAVEPALLALFASICYFSPPNKNKLTLLLDIGSDASSLSIAIGEEVYSVQVLSATEALLTEAINEDGSISSQPALASALENLIIDIEHSYKSVSNQMAYSGAVDLSRIIICGNLRHKGISAFLRGRFSTGGGSTGGGNILVEIFNPFDNLLIGDEVINRLEIKESGATFGTAVGLSLRGRQEDEEVKSYT